MHAIQAPGIAGRRQASLSRPFTCRDSSSIWPDVAWRLPTSAPDLAPTNSLAALTSGGSNRLPTRAYPQTAADDLSRPSPGAVGSWRLALPGDRVAWQPGACSSSARWRAGYAAVSGSGACHLCRCLGDDGARAGRRARHRPCSKRAASRPGARHQWRVHHCRCGPVHRSGSARAVRVAGRDPHDPG